MEQRQVIKQMVEFGQTAFNNAYDANTLLQDQVERVTNTMLDQAGWLPSEGRKAITGWVTTYKTGRDNFKKFVDDSYKQVNEIIAG
ncbi:MAG: hypothetical protein HKP58_15685 [Desulfatitalea sp.]|nr:hypothetical protein [Desulfatitalea sp.]NNK01852.1 hypothetical protein [Desulfatitalea sp.]